MVVEPRRTVSQARPRCKTISVRSMEHLRRWGIADQLRERAPLPVSWSQDVVFCTSLAGRELSRFTGVLGLAPGEGRYPEPGQQAPQFVLEQLLRDVAAGLPACTLVTGMKVTAVFQGSGEPRVTMADEAGDQAVVTAGYVLGCDGPRSTVRDELGSAYAGEHALRPNFGMVFRAPDLWQQVRHGLAVQYWIVNPDAAALMGPLDRTQTWWIIAFGVDREAGERGARQIIDAAAGVPVAAEILSTDPWTARMQIVDRMRCGRVFLAGDAAHLNPPFGGHGLNTGIGDAVDLGWKLAAVLDGWGDPALLDSYEIERRPIQEQVIRAATANMAILSTELLADNLDDDDPVGEQARRAAAARIQQTKKAEFHSLDLVLGLGIGSSPVIADDAAAGPGQTGRDEAVTAARAGGCRTPGWPTAGRCMTSSAAACPALHPPHRRAVNRKARMKLIALEEHVLSAQLADALCGRASRRRPSSGRPTCARCWPMSATTDSRPLDAAGIDMQVLSSVAPASQAASPEQAVRLARSFNDSVAAIMQEHPARFSGLAAAQEARRTIRDLGMCGVNVHGHTAGRFLDSATFEPLLAAIEDLAVSLYLHRPFPPGRWRTSTKATSTRQ
jgi:2-polyprenyl-6-methoxyphenol hydroxylase-like FAD-dependent oxidoreductase